VRGELQLNLDPAFQQELTNLIGFAPVTAGTYAMAGTDGPLPARPTQPSTATDIGQPVDTTVSSSVEPVDMPQTSSPTSSPEPAPRRKLQIERPVEPMAELTSDITTPVPLAESTSHNDSSPEAEDLRRQLANLEDLTRRAQAQLEEERKARQAMEVEVQQQEADTALLAQHYQDELARLQQHTQETASQTQQAQQQLEALQQQAQTEPQAVDPAQVQQQQSLVDKLKQEEQRSASFARELIQKMQQPVSSIITPATATVAAPVATAAAEPTPPAIDRTNLPVLASEANVINGFVFDAGGQFIDGAVVVIKDESGEAKRALKSIKLGQFVVTTPLADGHYVVEADKKGFSLAILNVELNGQPVPPLVIQANTP
jgi:hypothetical protein